MTTLIGTFACPICGDDTPHGHSEDVQTAYREDQIRNDGWTSAIKRKPEKSGWYLCSGIEVPFNPKKRSDGWMGQRSAQLSWFLWVRGAMNFWGAPPEVLYWDDVMQQWYLRNCLGNASVSGAESRYRVHATVKYWREIPPIVSPEIKVTAKV